MTEIRLRADIFEVMDQFKEVYAEITSQNPAEITSDDLANEILAIGLRLMMVDFFHMLDAQTLQQSLDRFYQEYPHLRQAEPVGHCDSHLANTHADLSLRCPKQFFPFMLKHLKASQSAKARERFRQLFKQTAR